MQGKEVHEAGRRQEFLGLEFDLMDEHAVHEWLRRRTADSRFAYVVTPNVDHLVRLRTAGSDVVRTYEDAALCLCDSRVLARLARWCGIALPVVTGSDLTAALFDILAPGDAVAIVGGSADMAAVLRDRYPRLRFHQHIPPMGLARDAVARAEAGIAAAGHRARIILLAVGSPQQELIAAEMRRNDMASGTALCIGASLDFIIGTEKRAPRFLQRTGLEWAWRLSANPKRLWRRYLVEGPAIFRMALRWRRARRN